MTRYTLIAGLLLSGMLRPADVCSADPPPDPPAESEIIYGKDVAPFLQRHCADCHGGSEPEAELALDRYEASSNVQADFEVWEKVKKMVSEGVMPPDGEARPAAEEVAAFLRGVDAELAAFDCTKLHRPGRVTIRRLNRSEYNNTIRDLVGIDFEPARDFPSDDVGHGFDNIADVLSMPPILMEKYLAAAEQVIERAMADETARRRILLHEAEEFRQRRDARRLNLRAFAGRAFRRPARDDELDRLEDLYRVAREAGVSESDAFQTALTAVLVSPHFLFRVEEDPPADDEDGIRDLDNFEIASRLSYFLWSSMPDDELFSLAGEKKLSEPETLKAQALRMLRDPKAEALVENFAGQWLQLRDVAGISPDPALFPDFDAELRQAMLAETQLFFRAVVSEDRNVLDFLDADFTFVNERLARHYGLEGISGDEFQRVQLSGPRRGVLTQASILAITSNPTRTSPVKRGKWILENILDAPPPPPPANVEPLEEDAEALGSLRERMEQHRSNETCAVCHRTMDTLGFGLENFDAVGAWRERDGRFDIDPAGTMPGDVKFAGPRELMTLLRQQKQDDFSRCLAKKMLTYALGRGLETYDRCTIEQIVEQLESEEFRFSSLIKSIVTSDPFLQRESKEPDP